MAVYTVHAPADDSLDARAAADQVVFVRDGFHFWAFAAAILWLIWNRLWLALVAYLALTVAAEIAMSVLGVGAGGRFAVMLVIALFVGLEAGTLRRWKLSGRKWRQVDVVVATNEEEAEHRFFQRRRAAVASATLRDNAAAPPPLPLPRASIAQPQGIVGLFPEPGAPR